MFKSINTEPIAAIYHADTGRAQSTAAATDDMPTAMWLQLVIFPVFSDLSTARRLHSPRLHLANVVERPN
jgi:hypothetical protein